ncbi:MAG: radical SAM protein [Pseudomonadota bacterium]
MTPGASGGAAISLAARRELWLHTGTACNLSCPFCHEGSQPGDRRLEPPSFDELRPVLDEAKAAGFERFAFTGGEPLILKDIVRILRHALQLAPCLVLTNGTAPLIRRPHHLEQLRGLAHPLEFRVSIDYPDAVRHDAGRGLKNFRKALEGLALLIAAGFAVSITRMQEAGEDRTTVQSRYRALLRKHGLPEDMPLNALPELGKPRPRGSLSTTPLAPPPGGTFVAAPACTRSRMVLRRNEVLRYSACPLVDDDPRFDLGTALAEALAATVTPSHPRCAVCRSIGVNYGVD